MVAGKDRRRALPYAVDLHDDTLRDLTERKERLRPASRFGSAVSPLNLRTHTIVVAP
jgi:hypothetical protein